MPNRAIGTTTSHTTTAAINHAVLQSYASIAKPRNTGVNAIRALTTVNDTPNTAPRLRSNQWVIETTLTRPSDPCPSHRIRVNPTASVTNPLTPLMATRPTPNATPIHVIACREPTRSIHRPTGSSAAAPTSVPMR